MLTVNSEVKKIYGKTVGKIHSKTGVSPIEFNANNQGLISWTMLGNGQQTGTPSPDAPIMPDFCGARTANLFDKYDTKTQTSLTYKYTISGLTPNAPYTCSTNLVGNKKLAASIYFNGGNSMVNGVWSDSPITSNSNESGEVDVYVRTVQTPETNPPVYNDLMSGDIWIMLNLGITALPYEPYGYKIPVTNAGTTTNIYALEPLRKIGDYADVVGSTGTVTRYVKCVDLGDLTWTSTGLVRYIADLGDGLAVPNTDQSYGLCSHLTVTSANTVANNTPYTISTSLNSGGTTRSVAFVYIPEFSGKNVDEFKVAVRGIKLWYPLVTPTTEQITAPTIPTQNGANTISVDSTTQPSNLTIQYTSPDMSEIVRVVDDQGKPLYGPRYGFKIDKSKTDSASAIIYTHDAVTMTPAYMDYTNGSFNYGSWGNVWFVKEAKPVALNLDGTIAYYLDPDDYTKKIDGTNSDIFYTLLSVEPSDWSTQWKQYYHLNNGEYVLNDDAEAPTFAANTYYKLETSFTGNFMVQFPKVYFKRYEDDSYNYVEVSDRKLSRDFKAYAHLNANGDELDFIYLPMFKGVIQSSKLRSIPGVIPQGETTASTEVTAAEACGTGWQIWDHSSREMINDLLVLMSKNADSQAKFGKGREYGYNASDTVTYGKLQTGTLVKKGAFYGYSTSYSDVKVFHIEGFWSNRWERLQGLLLVDGAYKIKMAPPYNFTGTDFVTLSTPSPTSNNYVRTLATSEYGSATATVSASASSPFKDYFYQYQSGTRVGLVGGTCYNGSSCGFRAVHVDHTASASDWYLGASAIYK